MRTLAPFILWSLLAGGGLAAAAHPGIAPRGTVRAAYIGSNLVQVVKDPATGEFRGVTADLARERVAATGCP
jgi:hypothetical protein